jgi:nicotinate-nucleotide--dimethylbenzimidazole phosphoribosyltransferase
MNYKITGIDPKLLEHYQGRRDNLTKPVTSRGRLEELVCRFAAIQHPDLSGIGSKYLFTFAADHGVALSGVSLYPREATVQMAQNFLGGGTAINVLCRRYGIQKVIVDVGVDHDFDPIDGLVQRKVRGGTRNFFQEETMTDEEVHQCVEVGFQLAQDYTDQGAGL